MLLQMNCSHFFAYFLVIAILAIAAQSQDEEETCIYKYYTVNTFHDQNSFSFSCFGNGKNCIVLYSPPGKGCDGAFLEYVGTLGPLETKVFESDSGFALGGGFCSENQIAVFHESEDGYLGAHLPRATEAGTAFHVAILPFSEAASYECTVSTLSSPAIVTLENNGVSGTLEISQFGFNQFNLNVDSVTRRVIKIMSDNPIIVSCLGHGSPNLMVTFQPISPKPLLIALRDYTLISVVISDCLSNELITNFSQVNVKYRADSGRECPLRWQNESVDIQTFYFENQCAFYVEPLDGVCISAGVQTDNFYLTAVGIPESKFSTQFARYSEPKPIIGFSFTETSCENDYGGGSYLTNSLQWIEVDLDGIVAQSYLSVFSHFSYITCDDSIMMALREQNGRYPFLSGLQSLELWESFFDYVDPVESKCVLPPPSPTSVPTSNANSLRCYMNSFVLLWFMFMQFLF